MKIYDMTIRMLTCAAVLSAFGCTNGANSGADHQAPLNLAGSRQGQAVGFVDVDGDGIADKIVGAPYATNSASRTGSCLCTRAKAPATAPHRMWS